MTPKVLTDVITETADVEFFPSEHKEWSVL